jgi:hypothetical protein
MRTVYDVPPESFGGFFYVRDKMLHDYEALIVHFNDGGVILKNDQPQ